VPPGASSPVKRDAEIQARQQTVLPSNIPAYASSCDNPTEYSSACNCWGITARTTTARRPRTTTFVTATASDCTGLALTAVPTCAYACFNSVAPQFGCTGHADIACQCQPAVNAAIASIIPQCLAAACLPAEIEAVANGAAKGKYHRDIVEPFLLKNPLILTPAQNSLFLPRSNCDPCTLGS
jgi:hypothetical protein